MFQVVENKNNLAGAASVAMIRTTRTELAKSTPFGRAAQLLEKLNDKEFDPYQVAYRSGMNVTTLFEVLDPSGQHENTQLDAFERVIRASGLRMTTDTRRGLFASRLQDMEDSGLATKRLIPELLARFYRSGINGYGGAPMERAPSVFLSSDYVNGSIMRPWAVRDRVIQPEIVSAIPISAIVAITTGINTDSYKGFYVDDDVDGRRMKRVVEAAELPRTKLKGREQPIKLYKYGRAIEISYETFRRMQIDMVQLQVSLMSAQAEADKVEEAIDVLVDGDGNNNAISTFNLTTLDAGATPGTLTLKGYTNFQLEFENPYQLNLMLVQKAVASQILLLSTGNANIPLAQFAALVGFGGVRAINRTADNIGLGWTADAPANKIVGVDTSKALERVYEIGASISEVERFITRQVEVLTFSEQEGFAILDKKARKALDISQ